VRRPARNALFLLGSEAGTRLLGFLVSAWLARRLGVDGFGQVAFALAVMSYGIIATKFGLLAIGIRETARDRSRVGTLAANILALRLILSVAAVLGMALFALLVHKAPSTRLLLLLFGLGVVAQSLLLEWVFNGIERLGCVALSRLVTNGVYLGLVVLLVSGPGRLLAVPLALAVATLAGVVSLLLAYVPEFGWPWPRLERAVTRDLVVRAWPVGIASVLTQLHVSFPIIALSLLSGDAAAGLFSAAHRLVFFAMMLDRIFQAVFFPVISRNAREHRDRLPRLTGTALRMVLAFGLPACAGLAFLARPILGLVFGAGYETATRALVPFAWFVLLSLLSSLAGYSLLAAGRERRFAGNTAIGVTVSLALTLVGIKVWGIAGAAWGILAGEACLTVLMGRDFLRDIVPWTDWRTAVPLAGCGVMVIMLLLLRDWNWIGAGLCGVATYALVLLLGRGLTFEDFGLLRRDG